MKLNHHRKPLHRALPLLLAATCSTETDRFPLDHKVKASYLFNLLRFIEWPSDSCGPNDRLNLWICGAYSLDGFYALHGEHIGGREISVERIKDLTSPRLGKCQILVVSGDKPVLSVPIARGLLTVGETDGFIASGGILNLLLIGGRVRFEINEEIARACGFAIDPKLSKLKIPGWYSAHFD